MRSVMTLALFALVVACDGGDPDDSGLDVDSGAEDTDTEDTSTDAVAVAPADETKIAVGSSVSYTLSGLDDSIAHRITLVVAANVTPGADYSGTFVDGDANGAADAGASEAVGLITVVQETGQDGAKTVPAGTDDPSAPSGVFPIDGKITIVVDAQAAGTVYPVFYHNGGTSTFLEIDSSGVPTETYYVGGAFTVE